MCVSYNNSIKDGKPPHLILDTTQTGVASEAVKTFAAALALPTMSASYGQDGDIRYVLLYLNYPAPIALKFLKNFRLNFFIHFFPFFRQWRNLDGEQQKYLVQINPPADIIPEVIRSIITAQNITDAGILYDDSFGRKINDYN